MYQEIDSYELKNIMNSKNINLIDIRDSYIYSFGTIGDAKNIPFNYLMTNPNDYLDSNKEYYIFCNSGNSSYKLCQYLSKLGYNVFNIIDGYQGYEDSLK